MLVLAFIEFSFAMAIASAEISIAKTFAAGSLFAMAIAMHPEPVPISRIQGKPVLSFARIHSTSSSVSGRGISTEGLTLNLIPKNSVSPRIY